MRIMKRIQNKVNREYSKYLIRTKCHVFQCGEVSLKYLYIPKRSSKTLITVFSGMNPTRASYSYINSLNDTVHNRLYILDDFGDDILGCYYLGVNERFQVEHAVQCLLKELSYAHQFEKYIFCGSSKGGYAALNFGIEYSDATIICAAPQYRLGYYLTCRKSPQLLHIIAGENPSQAFLDALNHRLSDKLAASAERFRGKIYLHYSDVEHTYAEHVQYLLKDLDKYHYNYNTDCKDYPSHDSVGIYFPAYLRQSLANVTEHCQ